MQFEFATVLIFFLVGAGFVLAGLLVRRILGPKPPPDANKLSTYECGEKPIGSGWFNFNPRFYVVALIFVIFEVEVALVYPVAVALRGWDAAGQGWLAFAELFTFVGVLALGLAYVWRKGDLAWVKRVRTLEDTRADTSVDPLKPVAQPAVPAAALSVFVPPTAVTPREPLIGSELPLSEIVAPRGDFRPSS